jgi:hypothetical protein
MPERKLALDGHALEVRRHLREDEWNVHASHGDADKGCCRGEVKERQTRPFPHHLAALVLQDEICRLNLNETHSEHVSPPFLV